MIKLLISDLDNTLLKHENGFSYIEEVDLQALALLKQAKMRFIVASGRHAGFVQAYLDQYDLVGDIIGANGATAFIDHQLVISHLVDNHGLRSIFDYLAATYPRIYMKVSTPDNQEYRYDTLGKHFADDDKIKVSLTDFLQRSAIQVNRFVVACDNDHLFSQLQDDLKTRFSAYFEFNQSAKNLMDVTPKGIDKGSTVCEVIKLLGYQADEVAAIGDSYNDISMLQAVGLSFAMVNGEDSIKKVADHIVKNVAEAITMIIKNV